MRDRETRAAAGGRFPIVITGHVDHGKSTLVGRLLADTGSVPLGKIAAIRAHCERTARPFEYAFLVDALKEERGQGITIAAARTFFASTRRTYMLLDVPGHLEFLKSMVSGASSAHAAFVVIDAHEGVGDNSRRHGHMLWMLGVTQVAVVINKMDLVAFRRDRYDQIVQEFGNYLIRFPVQPRAFIPICATEGDNIVTRSRRLDWYVGPTILDTLDGFHRPTTAADAPFRLPVQAVYKFTQPADDRRIIAGTVTSGRIRIGDSVAFHPSGTTSRIRSVEAFGERARTGAVAGEATGVTLMDDVFVRRGEVMVRTDEQPPAVGTSFRARVFWLGNKPLRAGKDYIIRLAAARVTARLDAIHSLMNATDLCVSRAFHLVRRNEVAVCTFQLAEPLAFDRADHLIDMARFVLVDNYEIAGGGTICEEITDTNSSRAAPGPRGTIAPAVVWLTGLSAAGKTAIASALYRELTATGIPVEYLDGDAVRLLAPTGFSKDDRDAHVRRVGFLASRLEAHGILTICALISPYAAARSNVRSCCRRFIEVYVSTPLPECERRDPKGLYARARRGEITNMTGIDDPYEPPEAAELTIDTLQSTVNDAVRRIMNTLSLA